MLPQIVILSALLMGSITDLKKREVPDTLNYSLIFLGLLMNLVFTILHLDASFIINSVAGLILGFGVGALFYYTGQWGGGDAKLVMGIGAVMGVNPLNFLRVMPDFVLFLITSLLVGAFYGITWLFVLAIKHHKKYKKEYRALSKNNNFFYFKVTIIFFAFLIIIGYFTRINNTVLFLAGSFLIFLTLLLYSKNFFKAVENAVLTKKIKVSELTEGDWLVGELVFKEKKIRANKTGLNKEDIDFLKKKNVKDVKVRQGIPFVPSFLIAYLILLLFGNWLIIF